MLYCTLLMLQGAGQGSLKCKTQPQVGTTIAYALYGLPAGGTLLTGDGHATHELQHALLRGEWSLEPLEPNGMWAAYISPEGEVLSRGAADGVWREAHNVELWRYLERKEVDRRPAPAVEAQTPPDAEPVDLADMGVVEVATEEQTVQVGEDVGEQVETTTPQKEEDPLRAEDLRELLSHFEDYPPYAPLEGLVAGSRWVRVGEENAYLLGLLYDSTPTLTHVCYGVEGTKDCPFSPDAEWLAAEGEDKGYWIVYRQVE